VLLHGHCHHKATGGIAGEQKLLEAMGMAVEAPEAGCCGMAGSFGFEAAHYDISMACGERVLLPEVRNADEHTLVVTDGFSCRTQIEQGNTGRTALHVAEVLRAAAHPEEKLPAVQAPRRRGVLALAAIGGTALLAGLALGLPGNRNA
jgi:Fe-S oxidoreductase